MATDILINGRRYGYASLEISILRPGSSSEIFIDIDEISYSEELEIALVRGTNKGPIGWTGGVYTANDANMRMGKSSFQKGIVEKIGNGWLGANVTALVKYADIGEPVITDKLIARTMKAEDSHSYGADNLKTALGLKCFMIERNGIKPI